MRRLYHQIESAKAPLREPALLPQGASWFLHSAQSAKLTGGYGFTDRTPPGRQSLGFQLSLLDLCLGPLARGVCCIQRLSQQNACRRAATLALASLNAAQTLSLWIKCAMRLGDDEYQSPTLSIIASHYSPKQTAELPGSIVTKEAHRTIFRILVSPCLVELKQSSKSS